METPQPPPPDPPQNSYSLTSLAIILAATTSLVALICISLSFVTLNYFLPVLIVAGGVFLFVGFHYVLWGWWLSSVLPPLPEEDEPSKEPLPDSFADDAARRWKNF